MLSKKRMGTHEQYRLNHRINDDGVIERRCSKCMEWKEETLEYFYLKNKSKPKMGFSPACRKCSTKASVDRYAKNPEPIREYANTYRAENIDKCINDIKQWRADPQNHNKKREYEIEYYNKYPEKHKLYNQNHRIHDITEAEWRSCLKVFNNECAYCGLPQDKHIIIRNGQYIKMVFHKEHVDDDGYNDLRNAIPSCRYCNSHKHKFEMEEWYKQQKFFNEVRYNKIIWWTTEGYKDYIDDKPPYRILKKKNEDNNKFHWNLWSVDDLRNTVEIISTKNKRKELKDDIKVYLLKIQS